MNKTVISILRLTNVQNYLNNKLDNQFKTAIKSNILQVMFSLMIFSAFLDEVAIAIIIITYIIEVIMQFAK